MDIFVFFNILQCRKDEERLIVMCLSYAQCYFVALCLWLSSERWHFVTFCHILSHFVMFLYFLTENMIRGLDSDETVFLDMVAKQQEDIANRRFDEESQEIKEYRVWLVFSCVCLKLA